MSARLRGIPLLASALAVFLPAAAGASCQSDQECPPWAQCSVSLGDCHSGDGPLEVCSGRCVTGERLRLVPRLGAVWTDGDSPAVSGSLGLEIVPPLLAGHLSLAIEGWPGRRLRFGAVVSLPVTDGLVLGLRGDANPTAEGWGALVSARVEYFPWWPFDGWTPAHTLSLVLEGGAPVVDPAKVAGSGFWLGLGLGIWLPAW